MNERFLKIVNTLRLLSNDSHTQTAVVIVNDDLEVISSGWNTIPVGVDDNKQSRFERPEKYYWFIHAEINAIARSAKNGIKIDGATMYMSCGIPCTDCAKAIINAGIKRIICTRNGGSKQEKWKEHFTRSMEMFNEAQVEVSFFD